MKRVNIAGLAVNTSGAPVIVLRELDEPHRVLPIVIGHPEAASIAIAAGDQIPERPLTHDLMAMLIDRLDGQVIAAEITGLRGDSFMSSLAVNGPSGEHRLDVRPSDALALAVRVGAPLLVSDEVLDAAGALLPGSERAAAPATPVDEASIDATVDEFRTFLDGVEPVDFDDDSGNDAGRADGHAA